MAVLHIEVCLSDVRDAFVRTDLVCAEISQWLQERYEVLRVGQDITEFHGLNHGVFIESIRVADYSGSDSECAFHPLSATHLDIHAYKLCIDEDNVPVDKGSNSLRKDDDGSRSILSRVTNLPCKSFHGLWDSMFFEESLPVRLLRYCMRMMCMMKNYNLDLRMLNWNRLILLYGPPGSGKTTLCQSLSQKLTIWLGNHFTQGKLIEINSQALLSKWFGESAKLVERAFNDIENLANDETSVICVLIDEVETLAGSREKVAAGGECGDALRVTNQLLLALDRLRFRSNVLLFCTSNLVETIDPAFLDRVDVRQYVPTPSAEVAYDILRSCLNELIRCRILTPSEDPEDIIELTQSHKDCNSDWRSDFLDWDMIEPNLIPTLIETQIILAYRPKSPGRKLWDIAQRCSGLSGRTLRRLPFLALAMYIYTDYCTVKEGLGALSSAVDEANIKPLN